MKKYIIHLTLPEINVPKKDYKNAEENAIRAARKTFTKNIEVFQKEKTLVLLKDDYTGQTFTTAVLVNLEEKNIDETINSLRKLDIVFLIETF